MPAYQGHILTDDVVVNYKKRDRDGCLHFLTNLDTSCHDLSSLISPTAKKVITSKFNSWFLKMNFEVKNMDIQDFCTNKSFKIKFKGNKYIFSFIDSKFSAGSVALLIHGTFGSYLYTGNFCYSPSFVRSPVLLPVIEEKAITRLYLDNTYYEQPSNFLGFDEIVSSVVKLIKSEPVKNFYLFAEKVTMDPLVAEIASKLEERVYVSEGTLEVMRYLGCESFFTRDTTEARVFINKTLNKQRNFENNITVYLNRFSERCKSFKKIEKNRNVYNFNFYCHCNHKEICSLLRILKPESMTFIVSGTEKPIFSNHFKAVHDFPRASLSKGVLTKPSNIEGNKEKKTPGQFIKPTIINKNPIVRKASSNKRIITVPKNIGLSNLNTNNADKNLACSSSVNAGAIQLNSTEYACPLRIRDVPEINNAGPSKKSNCTNEDGVNRCNENSRFNTGINNNISKEISNSDKNSSHYNVQSHSSPESLNYLKCNTEQSLNLIKLKDNNLAGNALKSINIKPFSPDIVRLKKGVPLVFSPKLVKENKFNETNSKVMQLPNINSSHFLGSEKRTIPINRTNGDVGKTHSITIPPADIQNTKILISIGNEKHFVMKDLVVSRSKMCDKNINISQSPILNVSEFPHASKFKNSVSILNNSFQKLENCLDGPQKSISSESENCGREIKQLEVSRNCTIDEDKCSDSLVDSVKLQLDYDIKQCSETPTNLQLDCDIKQDSETPTNLQLDSDIEQDSETPTGSPPCNELQEQPTCNEKNCENNLTLTTSKTCTVDTTTNNELTGPELGQLNKCCENVYQAATEDICSTTEKRCFPDDESGLPRKKLRNDSLRQRLVETNCQEEPVSVRDCSVFVRRNGFNRSYFYCVEKNCFLPKFCGFKKHEIRPRTTLIALRNLQKLLNN